MSLQIFLFHKLFCTNISQVELKILQPFSEAVKVLHKKSYSQTFNNIHRKTPVLGSLFLIKLQAIRHFLVNIGKFIRRPILKNICKQQHFWKVFCENVFQIRT